MADRDYTITSQTPSVEISAAGQGFTNVWEITYKVESGPAKGTIGRITVPDSDHNAAYVDAAIRSKLMHLHEISSLGGAQS